MCGAEQEEKLLDSLAWLSSIKTYNRSKRKGLLLLLLAGVFRAVSTMNLRSLIPLGLSMQLGQLGHSLSEADPLATAH